MSEFTIILIIFCVAVINFCVATRCMFLAYHKNNFLFLIFGIAWNIFSIWCLTFIRL